MQTPELKMSIFDNLQNFFGFDTFKGEQELVIANLLANKDTFVIMPTGGGKSMCYQLPGLMSEGVALVISPLIALMKNQVDQLRGFGSDDSICHFLNSSLSKGDSRKVKEDVLSGKTKLLYVAPESLTKEENVEFLKLATISFVAIDEAHCISEWGHDFRPEYRKIRSIINQLGDNIPLIALTATATPKVQMDIMKNLQMQDAKLFKSSFNRPNLYYQIRPKKDVLKEIIKFIKDYSNKSGIVYCLSRKKVEEVAETLQVNGIKALPYHAGLDANTRAKHQDMFLMEDVDVIVATIAFGMGIDKPDVRFVIHHDMPKSLESYYQETGRAGRDGGEGNCIAFYAEQDILKLSKFLKDKPVSEREIGMQLLHEVVDYAESTVCRRKQILHYFGETFDEMGCNKMCDNCSSNHERFDGREDLLLTLKTVKAVDHKFDTKDVLRMLLGEANKLIKSYKFHEIDLFGQGKGKDQLRWESVIRQGLLFGFLAKEIENFGVLRLTPKGEDYLKKPFDIQFTMNNDYSDVGSPDGQPRNVSGDALDPVLFGMLKDLRKKLANQKGLPPFVIFQDPSLEEMSTVYPITADELKQISGVGTGKAIRYGKPFLALIKEYVEENNIDRPADFVVKSTVNKSGLKVYIIQNVDKRVSVEDIARAKGLELEDVIREMEAIVSSGTKLNLDYYIDELLDYDRQDEVYDYFRTADSDSLEEAHVELGEDEYSIEEIQLMRLKFMSEMGN